MFPFTGESKKALDPEAVQKEPTAAPPEPHPLDEMTGGAFSAATSGERAQRLREWLATDPTGSGDPDFLVVGDLNSYAQEEPTLALIAGPDGELGTADDYTDLLLASAPEMRLGWLEEVIESRRMTSAGN